MSGVSGSKSREGRLLDGSFIVITVLFCLVVAGFGGLRLYIGTLDSRLTELDSTLQESSAQLRGADVDRVARFDDRLTLAKQQQMSDPVNAQKLLQQLESLVIPSVRLTKYEYNAAEKFVEVAGETDSFKYVAQQIISFKSDSLFAGIKVESLDRTEAGRIRFSLKAHFN